MENLPVARELKVVLSPDLCVRLQALIRRMADAQLQATVETAARLALAEGLEQLERLVEQQLAEAGSEGEPSP